MAYNYVNEVKDSVIDWIDMNEDILADGLKYKDEGDGLINYLYDYMVDEDSVTGNGSSSWTFNRKEAEDYIIGNLGLLADALDELGGGVETLRQGAEACDVLIRIYVLPDAIELALKELGVL